MLYLVFNLGERGYAIPAGRVVEILPFIAPQPVRGAPSIVAGSIAYRGGYLTVVDMVQLEMGVAAMSRMGTRIIVTQIDVGGRQEKIGLVLEGATEMMRCEPEAFSPFASSPRGEVQLLDIDALLPPQVFGDFFAKPLA